MLSALARAPRSWKTTPCVYMRCVCVCVCACVKHKRRRTTAERLRRFRLKAPCSTPHFWKLFVCETANRTESTSTVQLPCTEISYHVLHFRHLRHGNACAATHKHEHTSWCARCSSSASLAACRLSSAVVAKIDRQHNTQPRALKTHRHFRLVIATLAT